MTDFDSPWKEALDDFFEAFMALFCPEIHGDIDWQRGYEALDKELQQVSPAAKLGRRFVDKLVKVWRRNGREGWVLIHIEVQGQKVSRFARRMYLYNSRLAERYNRPVASVAVLADDNAGWRPRRFRRRLWTTSTQFRFAIVKLLDYAQQSDELEATGNPFVPFVLAYLKAREHRQNEQSRYHWKLRLVRGLYERGWDANRVRKLYRLIDWVITLPAELVHQFREEVTRVEQEKQMTYVTSTERLAIEEGRKEGLEAGREEGLRQGIAAVLEVRFGEAGLALMPEINALESADLLPTVLQQSRTVASPEDLRQCWR